MRRLFLLFLLSGCGAASLVRGSVPHGDVAALSEPGPTRPLVITARAYVDVRAGTTITPARIVVEDGRIVALGAPVTDGDVPADACAIDLGDAVLLPGLMDAHTHLLHLSDARDASESSGMIAETTERSDAARALRGVRFGNEMLRAGFTTVRDLGNSGDGGDLALRDAIAAGWVVGPRILASTRALAGARGQFERLEGIGAPVVDHEYAVIDGPEEARRAVRRAIAQGADGIKIIVGSETAILLSEEEVAAIVDEAHRAGRWVAAHATDDRAAAIAVSAGVDSIEHGYELSDATLTSMAERGIALVPTDYPLAFYLGMARDSRRWDEARSEEIEAILTRVVLGHRDRLARAHAHGVPIVAGSDAYYRWGERDRGDIASSIFLAYAESGLSPIDVLRAATLNAARLLRVEGELGEITVGAHADLIAVTGDPLSDSARLREVAFVVRGGVVVRDDLSGAACPPPGH